MMAAPAAVAGEGFYAGVLVGAGGGVREGCTSANFSGTPPTSCDSGSYGPVDVSNQVKGGLFGGQVGFDMMSGTTVYGIQATGTFGALSAPVDQWGGQITFNAIGAVTGKLGVELSNGAVLYGKAGVAAAMAKYLENDAGCAFSQTYAGVTGGAGVEYPLNDTFSLFAEANGYAFMNSDASCGSPAYPSSFSNTTATLGIFSVGVNAHFN